MAMKGTVVEGATESLKAAGQAYQVRETGKRIMPGEKLAKAYFDANLPIVRSGSIREGFGWRWCSTRRFRRTDG